MFKRTASMLILLAFLTPVLPALCGPGGNDPSAAAPAASRVRKPGECAARLCPSVDGAFPRFIYGAGFAYSAHRGLLVDLARFDAALAAVRHQESALAGVVGADRTTDCRDYEERRLRHRVPLHAFDHA